MIVRTLAVEGFMGYARRCALDFEGRQTIGIVGPNECGKSTLLQAISYAMYGRTLAEREVQLINDDCDRLIVESGIELPNGELLEITRGRTDRNEAILGEHITERLRLAYDDFVALTYFVQGDLHKFMEGNKREYFQRWTAGLRVWRDFEGAAADEVVGVERTLRERQIAREAALRVVEAESSIRAEARSARAEMLQARQAAERTADQVRGLQAEVKAQETSEELRRAADTLADQLDALRHQIQRAESQVSTLNREARQIRSGTCPLLSIECPELEEAGKEQRRDIGAKLREAKAHRGSLGDRHGAVREQIADIKSQLSQQPVRQLKIELRDLKQALNGANRDLHRATQRNAQAQVALESVKAAREKLRELKKGDKAITEDLRRWQFVRFMCSKNGIPASIIERELERVESRCNWVLERLDYPKRIRFSGFKELASFEKVCPQCGGEKWHKQTCRDCGSPRPRKRREEPTVTVVHGTNERPFALESGGGKTLQSFAARMAGSLFVAAMTGIPMRMVMLDEVFGMLDADNRQKLMALVIDKLSTEFGLQQQLVVSHQEDVINAVDDLLIVGRERGSSVARWA
jgi:DNA repair exonuclease SbcCD ATPase subunit